MNREGFTGFSRGEARTRTATSLNFETQGPLNKLMRLPWGFILLIAAMALTGGMAPAALHPVGMGLRVPVASNDSEVGRQENRRVVIIVAPNDAMSL